jgi:toxin YoeB
VRLCFEPQAWEDYLHWQEVDRKKLRRLNELIRDALRHPFEGVGKPEPLRHELAGAWSRRIDQEHRLVYLVAEDRLIILQCRSHY